jgi:hypothetical protein
MSQKESMTEPASLPDPQKVASVRRRLGFVATLWWVAAISGAIGLLQGLAAGWGRLLFIGIAWVLAVCFTYAWWQIRRGSPQ